MLKQNNDLEKQNRQHEPTDQEQLTQLLNPMYRSIPIFVYNSADGGSQVLVDRTNPKDRNPLRVACLNGDLQMVRNLIKTHNCSPECKDSNGLTLVHITCVNGFMKLAKYLVEEIHCDPHCKNNDGLTPVHVASLNGYTDLVKYLVEQHHCDPAIGDNHGWTPLHVACENGHIILTKYLIEKQHCDPNCRDNYRQTPLHLACKGDHLDVAKYLTTYIHCNPTIVNCNGQTPMHVACEYGQLQVVKYLADELECDPACKDSKGHSPLHAACQRGHLCVAKYLVESHKCNPACKSSDGWTPLAVACIAGQYKVAKYLIQEQRCDPSSKDNIAGYTSLHTACIGGHFNIVEYLIEGSGCDPNAIEGIFGLTPVHLASSGGHLVVVKYLIEMQHCNPSAKGKLFGTTPLHLACQSGHLHVAKYLIEHQHCDPVCKNNVHSSTPMHAACFGGHIKVVKYLIDKQLCDLTCKTRDSKTPLHIVCENGHLNLAKYLIEGQKCDPNATAFLGSSPLSLACRHYHLDIIVYLVSHCRCTLGRIQSTLLLSDSYVKDHTDIVLFLLSSLAIKNTEALKHILFHPAFKVFVVGNSSSGKSTLIKALQSHLLNQPYWFTKQYKRWMDSRVTGVESHTAGIIPIAVQTPAHGLIIMYDFAGQAEYYSSHAAVCENQISSTGSLILIVYNVSKSEEECVQELKYWKSFIDNQSKDPSIIVIASHADVVRSSGQDPLQKAHQVVKIALGEQICYTIVIDCRLEASDGLEAVLAGIKGHCDSYRRNVHVDPKAHFCQYLTQKYGEEKLACQLADIMSLVFSKDYFVLQSIDLLPKSSEELAHQLSTLSKSGDILFLKNNRNIDESWLIFKKEVLLAEINAIIFAPSNFKQHQIVANSTGVVPLSNIKRLFSSHDHQMITGFLTHLEFCHEIAKSEANLISDHSKKILTLGSSNLEIFYFFPALVKTEIPEHSKSFFTKSRYVSGWCLHDVSSSGKFLTPRFLHTLLLRLMFSYALKCEREVESIVVQRECNVWKNGIHWMSDSGVEAIVEVVEQSTAVIMVVGCLEGREMECTYYRSQLIQTILQAKEEFASAVEMREALIDPNELRIYPLEDIKSLITYSVD